ncbi:hypothetical protein P154DRAFT_330079 [Amniculicola lignicola CBS 123094]|uniref:Uncharacterized protein n=1 Tax=Amniculicola lignicola CBS 123094 TaxID=1392246 RepID=A0A6A5W1S8_9PLEO|nr:hypothetical protein P154DRAFT_330079 [Amniculicola lignicola CBS 123094]
MSLVSDPGNSHWLYQRTGLRSRLCGHCRLVQISRFKRTPRHSLQDTAVMVQSVYRHSSTCMVGLIATPRLVFRHVNLCSTTAYQTGHQYDTKKVGSKDYSNLEQGSKYATQILTCRGTFTSIVLMSLSPGSCTLWLAGSWSMLAPLRVGLPTSTARAAARPQPQHHQTGSALVPFSFPFHNGAGIQTGTQTDFRTRRHVNPTSVK